jgi:hypothetical protein
MTAVIAGTVVAHGLLLILSHWSAAPHREPSHEATLGVFHFVARGASQEGIAGATFELSVTLLDDMAPLARARLTARQRKVKQNVEQLLRRAHPGDFDDPTLVGLKRHLQTEINEALGIRAIEEVLITDLLLKDRPTSGRPAPPKLAVGQTAAADIAP